MARPLLPPRGIFVPTRLIYARDLPAAILQTWVQLRGLAWGADETPPLSFKLLAELTGKSQSCLYGHLTFLRTWGALRWRPSGTGTFIVLFDNEAGSADPSDASFQDSRNLELPDPSLSSNQLQDSEDHSREGKFQDSRNLENPDPSRAAGLSLEPEIQRREGGIQDYGTATPVHEAGGRASRRQATSRTAEPENEATNLYRRQIGIRPNPAQRKLIAGQVTDLALWDLTLEHWLSHGWSPRNIAGQLELYHRGGPSGCHYCQKENNTLNQTLKTLDQMRKELNFNG